MLADIFDSIDRGIAISIFSGAVMCGPAVGPIVGGFVTISYLGWRWTEYITAIMGFFFTGIAILIVPETYEPILLESRAKKLRHKTRNWAIHAKSEESAVNIKVIAEKYLLRPFQMLALEPILLLVTLYMGFIYGFLYMCFNAYPISFQELRGWNEGVGALPFLAIVVGVIIACVFVVVFSKTRLQRQAENFGHIVPEERLIPMMIGGLGMLWQLPYKNRRLTLL